MSILPVLSGKLIRTERIHRAQAVFNQVVCLSSDKFRAFERMLASKTSEDRLARLAQIQEPIITDLRHKYLEHELLYRISCSPGPRMTLMRMKLFLASPSASVNDFRSWLNQPSLTISIPRVEDLSLTLFSQHSSAYRYLLIQANKHLKRIHIQDWLATSSMPDNAMPLTLFRK